MIVLVREAGVRSHYLDYDHHHGGDCELNEDCYSWMACQHGHCSDPCIGACGYNANCQVLSCVIKHKCFLIIL